MKNDAIVSILKATMICTLVSSLTASLFYSLADGAAIFIGALWACLNFALIAFLIQNCVQPKAIFIRSSQDSGERDKSRSKRSGLNEEDMAIAISDEEDRSAAGRVPDEIMKVAQPKGLSKIFLLLGLKFPTLYFIGYKLLTTDSFSFVSILIGSSLIFVGTIAGKVKMAFVKKTIIPLLLLSTPSLHASLDADVPEVPNFFTLLNKAFNTPLTAFLHEWESVIFSIIIAVGLSILFYLGARKQELLPTGLQNFIESIVEILRNFIVEILGPEGEKFVPLLGSLFVYILTMNWVTVLPFIKPPTSSINITIALAVCVFVLVQYLNFRNWGLKGFLYHMAGSPKGILGWALVPLMFPIEVLTQLTRPLTLALRLFGNIVGEDILIGAAALFGVYLLSSTNLAAGIPMQLPFMFLALLTGLMQALVFTLLSTIYILLSMPPAEESADHF